MSNELNFFFLIGRLSPPHIGHIYTIKSMIDRSKQMGCIAYILLGEGSKKNIRTLKDPINFELKSNFVRDKLISLGYKNYDEFIILSATNGINKMINEIFI